MQLPPPKQQSATDRRRYCCCSNCPQFCGPTLFQEQQRRYRQNRRQKFLESSNHSVEIVEIYPHHFLQNLRETNVLLLNYTVKCFHEIFSRSKRKILVFPHCGSSRSVLTTQTANDCLCSGTTTMQYTIRYSGTIVALQQRSSTATAVIAGAALHFRSHAFSFIPTTPSRKIRRTLPTRQSLSLPS